MSFTLYVNEEFEEMFDAYQNWCDYNQIPPRARLTRREFETNINYKKFFIERKLEDEA
jgi:hypothetical protein